MFNALLLLYTKINFFNCRAIQLSKCQLGESAQNQTPAKQNLHISGLMRIIQVRELMPARKCNLCLLREILSLRN